MVTPALQVNNSKRPQLFDCRDAYAKHWKRWPSRTPGSAW